MAKTIFADMTNGWDTQCGGGLWWSKSRTYKNAIPNELFLLAAIRLHSRTPGDGGTGSYFFWATNEWSWFKNGGMINANSLVNDGLTSSCLNNNGTTWTYNQGVIIGGLTDLYRATGDGSYLAEATSIAFSAMGHLSSGGVLTEPCPTCGSSGDVVQFKGIFIRNLAMLYDTTHASAYYTFLYNNAHSVWFNDRNTSNQFGYFWTGPYDTNDAARQSSAIMPLGALAAPSTALLPFAKSAGDPVFNHAVGAASSPLAWLCNPANAPAGYMQTGPYLASLPPGTHIAHFRLAVNALGYSPASLVQLNVREDDGGTILATRDVAWQTFTAANQAEDFALAFTNAPGDPLEFQVYWNDAPGAPTLTLSGVTIDGFHNWTAASLAHDIGRLDQFNNWQSNPVNDTVSGYLARGPGTAELPEGDYTAKFELKVDNFNWDNSVVATLSVVNADANTVVASRDVTRSEFPNVLYRAFGVNFHAVAGVHYDFRTYWYYAANSPRLTERSVVVAPASAASFNPITLTPGSYNEDMVVERTAPAVPGRTHTSASMDAGTGNTGTSWYEQGYNASAPATGLPPAGSTITGQLDSTHTYTFAASYTVNNAAMVDSSHGASLAPASPSAFSALSFLTSAGHGPVLVDCRVKHADGSSETAVFNVPDWFLNSPIVWNAQGRVDVNTGSFTSVNGDNPRLYALEMALTNTASPVTNINLTWDSANSGNGVAAVFAVSGSTPYALPFNVTVAPLSQTRYMGTAASFSASANGTAPLDYQWAKDGAPISGATNSALELSNLEINAAGNYTCTAINGGGSATSAAAGLAVLPLPLLNATFANGQLTLIWTNPGALLEEATNVTGPWLTNSAATPPWQINPSEPQMFYRIQVQ